MAPSRARLRLSKIQRLVPIRNRIFRCFILFVSAVLAGLAVPVEARRYALLLGNNQGGSDLDSLDYAESDARRMAEVLINISGFDAADVKILVNADSVELERTMEEFRKRLFSTGASMDGLFLFYYSGHADKRGLRLGEKSFPLDRLRENFQSVPSQVKIGIFDACQSGLMTRFKGGSTSKPLSLESLKNIQGQVIIASSSMDEKSQESDQLRSSIFTHHWITGLKGSADISGDRRVTLTEAYQYAHKMTLQATSKTRYGVQHAAYQYKLHGEGDIVLADLNLGGCGLVFASGSEGKYLVIDWEQRHIVADFYKPIGKELLISLSGGEYKVFKVEQEGWRMADTRVAAGRTETFKPSTLVLKPQVVNPIKGEIEAGYRVLPGPVDYKAPPLGATHRFGISLKIGESTGFAGFALIYNPAPDIQIQGGWLGMDGGGMNENVSTDDPLDDRQDHFTNAFALFRKYEGPYFADAGLIYQSESLSIRDSSGTGKGFGWELGVPVHVGIEVGPRRSVFATLSIGYTWLFTGGGDLVAARTPSGSMGYTYTDESSVSIGLAVGAYFF